ncbi:MAG TPA: hypothetical protein VJ063_16425, partial [Verrucomicrobiae bacterium]|nr:hypothetical protein [Verrucomicrobiae bacterium]
LVLVDPTQEELIAWAKARDAKPSDQHKFRAYDEVDCAPATFAQALENPIATNMPVVLISGQGPRVIPRFVTKKLREEVQKDQTIFYPAKLKFHTEWVERFPEGQLITTENSGHGIPFEEPNLVIHTIRELVNRIRLFSTPGKSDGHRR